MSAPNPYKTVIDFENAIAEFCGSKYAVAVESCTSALFLSLVYEFKNYRHKPNVHIPARTYPGVACSIIHAGGNIIFEHEPWEGEYQLYPHRVWDAALRFKKGMYEPHKHNAGLQCLSFHVKKNLPIGRGSCILTDDLEAVKWLRKARFDGRDAVPLLEDNFTMLGWNCYLQPEQAARGLMLMQSLLSKYPDGPPDLIVSEQGYPNLDLFPIYKQRSPTHVYES